MFERASMGDSVPAEVRRARLRESVREEGFVRVADAALRLGVSEVTVRSDLAALEASGSVQRVHGGAMPRGSRAEETVESASAREVAAKLAIGRAAASLVRSGQSIVLDVGSTTLAVAHALVDRAELDEVLVVTNGLAIALALEPAIPRFTVVVAGGTLRPLQHSLVDPFAGSVLDAVHCDLAILGCNGVDVEHGISNLNLPETDVKRRMARSVRRTVVVADASKLGVASLGRVVPLAEVHTLVTDARGALLEPIRAAGVEVVVA
ncbi:MAG: DeoR/GlpR family DNA-binding transcription regulator [Microbacteriaceae bacterium]